MLAGADTISRVGVCCFFPEDCLAACGKEGMMKQVNTPYDDVFRTLLNDCSSLIIPVINEVFCEHYTGKERIIFSLNEHFLNRQDGEESERITDTSFRIVGEEIKKYHWECQSSPDYSMLIRFFEYDAQIALDEGSFKGNSLSVSFPYSAVLFLRSNVSTPDNLKIEILTPGGAVEYSIPVMKLQDYTIEEVFEKRLLFLIPFYIFSYESRFEDYEKDLVQMECLKLEYQNIMNTLEELVKENVIDEYTKCTIVDMSKKVLEHIAQKYEAVKEGVRSVMGGKVLEYEAKTIKNEGKLEMLFDLVRDNLLSLQEAISRAGLPEEVFLKKMNEYKM